MRFKNKRGYFIIQLWYNKKYIYFYYPKNVPKIEYIYNLHQQFYANEMGGEE